MYICCYSPYIGNSLSNYSHGQMSQRILFFVRCLAVEALVVAVVVAMFAVAVLYSAVLEEEGLVFV